MTVELSSQPGPFIPLDPRPQNGHAVAPAVAESRRSQSRWRPGVRLVLVLVVLLPTVSAAVLIGSDASYRRTYRASAEVMAREATQLQALALARAELNNAEYPLSAVAFAGGLGISETMLSSLLSTNMSAEIAESAAKIAEDAAFTSTPTLRTDFAAFETQLSKVQGGTSSYHEVESVVTKVANDLDNQWYADFAVMENDEETWQPPGSFGVHMNTLRETYAAFLDGNSAVQSTEYILQDEGDVGFNQALIESTGQFTASTGEIAGHLGPEAQAAWNALRQSPQERSFPATISEALTLAVNGERSPYFGNATVARTAITDGLAYLAGLDALVDGAAGDLRNAALVQAQTATRQLDGEVVFLILLALVSFGGVLVVGNVLTRPLRRLVRAAQQIDDGDFDLEQLPSTGPREVITTTSAFNDMASTLKAVEAKTVALSAENLSHPELQTPLPGRTGQALQAAVDRLTTRIRERELQREQLHEDATHDWLTGLLNRVAVFDFLTSDVARRRENGETVAVIFADLDELKAINDTYGHVAGDLAIEMTGKALLEATGKCDVVGRLGGDEFLVVLCSRDSQDSRAVAEHIRQTVARQSIHVEDTAVFLRCSVGVALAKCDADTDPMDLVRQADEAMYEAKRAARASQSRLPLRAQRI